MIPTVETIEGMIEPGGHLRLSHQTKIGPGSVQVTIRCFAAVTPRRTLADVIREIRAAQDKRGGYRRTAEEMAEWEAERMGADEERDRILDAARRPFPSESE